MKTAKRLDAFEAYGETAMNAILAKMSEEGKDVINLGLGNPDVRLTEEQQKVLADACMNHDNHYYPSFYSTMQLKEAVAAKYQRRFGASCDPETEGLPLMRPAQRIFHAHTCMLVPKNIALVPDPSYLAYEGGDRIAGGVVEPVPSSEKTGSCPIWMASTQARRERRR